MHQCYRDRASFCTIYIREAHPTDEWQVESNRRDGVEYAQPTNFADRLAIADECMQRLRMTAPVYLDGMDNAVEQAFGAWPERLFVVGVEGRIAYQGGKGPYGFNTEELDAFLQDYLG